MTRLCLTLCRPTLEENLEDLKNSSPDLAELRIDLLTDLESYPRGSLLSFPEKAGLPLILTCRKTADGGAWSGTDSQREALLLELMEGGYSYIDLEEDEDSKALHRKAREKGILIIRSFHDFLSVPEDLEERLESMSHRGDLVKAALMPRGINDLLILFQAGRTWQERHPGEDRLIILGMGAYGVPSRILAPLMGCFLTFCSPPGAEAAPGHMSWETLHELYRVQELTAETGLYGIIGNPVLHTRSPQIHNPGFRAAGINAVYVPFTVDDLDAFFTLANFLNISGFSVTVPHKEAVRAFLQQEDEAVQVVGACNTVVRMKGSRQGWEGFNTDVIGFIEPLKEKIPTLKEKKAAVIGAGGAARSAVFALLQEGCELSIFNRSENRALQMAEEFCCAGGSLDSFKEKTDSGETYDLIIQTTTVGMGEGKPEEEQENPIPFFAFTGKEVLYDIIYIPRETPLMAKASRAGCTVLGGMPMLLEQGRAQFRLFTGTNL
ncbi:shikimate dehydrogenase [Oceanispirochaeta sp.]|jgi:3-dehydroquinate dehydratase/shikimate dehydrogenase|uniref:shikimate dehydrogenase n=1 Tax=Oceanispirochaeta sp. TaxID=2035350 RepID=UPI002638376C|nr:shikimate dehydrogenase [Oceanispirochaeta sp.]MDA3958912.1 shikimate dehydrogenase [Oceanispirochaeta sp.]